MRTAKTLIRLGGCPGWSESSLGAHSFCWFCCVAVHIKTWLSYKHMAKTGYDAAKKRRKSTADLKPALTATQSWQSVQLIWSQHLQPHNHGSLYSWFEASTYSHTIMAVCTADLKPALTATQSWQSVQLIWSQHLQPHNHGSLYSWFEASTYSHTIMAVCTADLKPALTATQSWQSVQLIWSLHLQPHNHGSLYSWFEACTYSHTIMAVCTADLKPALTATQSWQSVQLIWSQHLQPHNHGSLYSWFEACTYSHTIMAVCIADLKPALTATQSWQSAGKQFIITCSGPYGYFRLYSRYGYTPIWSNRMRKVWFFHSVYADETLLILGNEKKKMSIMLIV